jgi:hypothetical protein
MAAAMTDHIPNNPFGRSTDGHKDDWSAVQIGGYFVALPSRADTERVGEVCASCRLVGRNFAPYSPGQFGPRQPPTPAHEADLQKLQAGRSASGAADRSIKRGA